MASNFSTWLRETARLYLRYAAVGLIGVPLALLYAWASRSRWNAPGVIGALILVGSVAAFFLWRSLGEWQSIRPEVPDTANDAWADLVNAALHTTSPHQQFAFYFRQSIHADEEQIREWNLLLRSAVVSDTGVAEAAQSSLLAQQTFQTERQPYQRPEDAAQIRQTQPAWGVALKGQTRTAHGLA
jgi:hypothetical protein